MKYKSLRMQEAEAFLAKCVWVGLSAEHSSETLFNLKTTYKLYVFIV